MANATSSQASLFDGRKTEKVESRTSSFLNTTSTEHETEENQVSLLRATGTRILEQGTISRIRG